MKNVRCMPKNRKNRAKTPYFGGIRALPIDKGGRMPYIICKNPHDVLLERPCCSALFDGAGGRLFRVLRAGPNVKGE